jgi:glyoxylase-like metal-dependent hydrolase (beta-lactamase superfamily II)
MSFDLARVRAENPSALTLSGTNTWVLGRDPCWVVDPGPLLDDHVAAVLEETQRRGGLGGIAITHSHSDHTEAIAELRARTGDPPVVTEGELGPLRSLPTPGHAPDHVAWLWGRVACTGDAVLGEGSVFVSPGRGSLSGYLDALRALRALDLELLLPGHGPPVDDPAAKLDEYLAHRLERERKLVEALGGGRRSVEELLDAAWSDVPEGLRPAAAITLAAHLDKLAEEDRLPADVQRPEIPAALQV